MGQFLIVVPPREDDLVARDLFRRAVELARLLKSHEPSRVVESGFALVASFPRGNGSGAPVAVDPARRDWLATAGTWFHESGLSSGDEPRLLARFLEVGADRLARELEGFFVIALGDARRREVTVITDVIGSCHCFARSLDGATVISGSSLLLAALGRGALDPIGCQELLATGAIYEQRSLHADVSRLGPGACVTYRDGAAAGARRYWELGELPPDSLDGAAAVATLREAMLGAARRIHAAHPRTVCDLTGGYDSRITVATFLAAGIPLSTTVSGPPTSPDVVIASGLAEITGVPHLYIEPQPVGSLDEVRHAVDSTDGEFDAVEYARILAVQTTLAARFDISVNGYAGEHGRGYGWEVLFPRAGRREPIDAEKLARRRFVPRQYDPSLVPAATRLDLVSHFREVVARTGAGLTDLPNSAQYDYCMLMLRAARWQGRIASATNELWPCLSFFLMRSVLDVMLKTHTRQRRRSLLVRRLMLELHPALAARPLDGGYPALPLSWRNVHRFVPLLSLYGGKALARMRRRLGGAPPAERGATGPLPRLLLWRDPAVRDVLDRRSLRCAEFLDADALDSFLRRSTEERFAFSDQWARLLSVELALRRLDELRSRVPSVDR